MIKALEISLIITAIYISMQEGMIFENVRIFLHRMVDKTGIYKLKKPIFDCLICMGGIYTLIVYPALFGFDIDVIKTMLLVIGINTIIDKIIHFE